jgi:hypothetical protein
MLSKKALMSTAVAAEALPIEDVFSTYLYTGNGSTQTITNGIDLAGEGGLVWTKRRNNTLSHQLFDTLRGANVQLATDATNGNITVTNRLNSFNVDGFTLGGGASGPNVSSGTYASWTFRQAPRFFDVVTYTGTGSNRTIAHSLGVVPGCIIVKRTDASADWQVYHRSNANTEYMVLNTTAAKATGTTRWNSTTPTSTVFSLGTDTTVNASGGTYVAYLFAHDPLGPSGDGSDGLIACGLHTQAVTDANELINLGWEPQWVLTKRANSSDDWILVDNMRGFLATGNSTMLRPNLPNVDGLTTSPRLASNGFVFSTTAGQQHIYIAIRRGPMREPTSGTQVFAVDAGDGSSVPAWTSGFPVDMALERSIASDDMRNAARLISGRYLVTNTSAAEVTNSARVFDYMNGWLNIARSTSNYSWMFRRAPGFFDVVAYTGTGATPTVISHNLKVVPEMMIIKSRTSNENWMVYHAALGNTSAMVLTTSAVLTGLSTWNSTTPSATTFTLGGGANNGSQSGQNYIAYLFASLPGISKVGSYTGNGSNQTINCGFTTGARFILIKRTDSTGDWYVWDTARGIVAGNDPFLELNTTDAEVTSDDSIDPDSSGFIVNQTATTNVNVSSASYIYLAIA